MLDRSHITTTPPLGGPDATGAWSHSCSEQVFDDLRRGQDRRAALTLRIAETGIPYDPAADPELVAARLDLTSAWRQLPAVHRARRALRTDLDAMPDGGDRPPPCAVPEGSQP